MAVEISDIRAYGIASPATGDGSTPVGGAIDLIKAIPFRDAVGLIQGVSSDAGDIGNFVLAAFGLDSGGNEIIDSVAPAGQTPVPFAMTFAQLLRGNINNTSAAGDVAIEAQTATREDTAQAGSAGDITLDAGASATNQFYLGEIIRITGGTGAGQIRLIIAYDGATKIAIVDRAWAVNPDNTSTFRISSGFYFAKAPNQIQQVWRLLYHIVAPTIVDPAITYYDKFFFRNDHATDTLNSPFIGMTDPTGKMAFGLDAAINDTLTTTDRLTAPAGITFATTPAAVPGGSLGPGDRIGVWVRFITDPGDAAIVDAANRFSITGTP